MIPISSKAYIKFEKDALEQLLSQKQVKFDNFITVDYAFYIQGKYHVDVDNLIAGINDILEKSGIIKNDDNIVSGCFKKIGGSAGWSTKITIRELPHGL